jgi:hypothetical protein
VGQKRERRFRRSDLIAFLEDQPGLVAQSEKGGNSGGEATIGGVQLAHGSHLCSIYSTDQGRSRQAVAFLADGLSVGTTCFFVGSPPVQRQVLDRLEKGYSSLQTNIVAGNLIVDEYRDTVAAQIDYWETSFLRALSRGARSIRVVGDVSGGPLVADPSSQTLMQYEEDYDRFIARRFPVVTLCQYSTDLLLQSGLRNVFCCHSDTFAYPVERLID